MCWVSLWSRKQICVPILILPWNYLGDYFSIKVTTLYSYCQLYSCVSGFFSNHSFYLILPTGYARHWSQNRYVTETWSMNQPQTVKCSTVGITVWYPTREYCCRKDALWNIQRGWEMIIPHVSFHSNYSMNDCRLEQSGAFNVYSHLLPTLSVSAEIFQ